MYLFNLLVKMPMFVRISIFVNHLLPLIKIAIRILDKRLISGDTFLYEYRTKVLTSSDTLLYCHNRKIVHYIL